MEAEKVTCCYCKEELDRLREYTLFRHLDNGKTHIYSGHKGCLFIVETAIKQGTEEGIPFTEIDTPKWNLDEEENDESN